MFEGLTVCWKKKHFQTQDPKLSVLQLGQK